MKKYLSVVILMLIVFSSIMVVNAAIPSNVYGTRLETDYVKQRETKWCWAATAENAIIWEGAPTRDQADAVRHIKGSLFNPHPNIGGSIDDMRDAAEYISKNTEDYISVNSTKSFNFISEQIYNRHPVLAGTVADTYAHAVLVMGWDTSSGSQTITFFDPGDGKYKTCTYAAFCNGSYNGTSYVETCYNAAS